MKKTTKSVCFLLSLLISFGFLQHALLLSVFAITWNSVSASKVTKISAYIEATFNSVDLKTDGFYIGIAGNSLEKVTKDLNGKADGSFSGALSAWFNVGKNLGGSTRYWYGALRPNTTYNYKIYVNVGGTEYTTDQKSFTTLPAYITAAFNANGGEGVMENCAPVKYNEQLTLSSNTFTRHNYEFQGWNVQRDIDGAWFVGNGQGWQTQSSIDSNGYQKKLYSDGGSYGLDFSWYRKTGNSNDFFYDDFTITFYAVWKQVARDVSLDPDGGTCSLTSLTVPLIGTYGDLPIPERNSYLFEGWFLPDSNTQVTEETDTQEVYSETLIAHWVPDMVSFEPNGGVCSTQTLQVSNGSFYGTLPTAKYDGYVFQGWYTAAEGGTRITQYQSVTADSPRTLYAHWSPKSCRVSFNANGGTVSELNRTVTFASPYGALPVPTRRGYSFVGWKLEGNETYVTESTEVFLTSNHVLIAQWGDRSIEDITVETLPAQTTYTVFDTLNTQGLVLCIQYDNGEIERVYKGFSCYPTILNEVGSTTVIVSFGTAETAFSVIVGYGAPERIEILQMPTKTAYRIGDPPNLDGLQLSAIYHDGSRQVISDGITCSPAVFTEPGNYRVTVSYEGKSTFFPIIVKDRKVSSLSLVCNPDRISYYVGEVFDPTGMVVSALFDDGTNEIVEPDYSKEPLERAETPEQDFLLSYSGEAITITLIVVDPPQQTTNLLSVSDCAASYGDLVTIPVALQNNTGLIGFELYVEFDPNVLSPQTPQAARNGELVASLSMNDGEVSGMLKVVAYGTCDEIVGDGNIAYVSFYVNDNIDTEQTTVSFLGQSFNADPSNENHYLTQTLKETHARIAFSDTVSPRIVLPDISVQIGESFDFPIELRHFTGHSSFSFSIYYDNTLFELIPTTIAGVSFLDDGKGTITIERSSSEPIAENVITITLQFTVISEHEGSVEFQVRAAICDDTEVEGQDGSVRILLSSVTHLYAESALIQRNTDTVSIPVYISNNTGIMGMAIRISYDPSCLLITDIRGGELFSSGLLSPNFDEPGCAKIVYSSSSEITADGMVFELEFHVQSSMEKETTVFIDYSPEDMFNESWDSVALECESFTINYLYPGDANEDGAVTLQDVVVITRWLAGGWNVKINETNSDVNHDGVVNLKDAVLIRRFLAGGWGVVLQ